MKRRDFLQTSASAGTGLGLTGPALAAAASPGEAPDPLAARVPPVVVQGAGLDVRSSEAGGADPGHPHLFHLLGAAGNAFPGGSLQGAIGENWPILKGQQGSVYLARLKPGGVREPHWHPSAWELNYVISGRVRWSLVGPNATSDVFEGRAGDLVFAPQGHFHYFENASETEELIVLVTFNASASEPDDDVGLASSITAVPADVMGAVFGVSPEVFRAIPKQAGRVVIARKPGYTDAQPGKTAGKG